MSRRATLVWLRRDLRLADNPALDAAAQAGGPVIPVYIDDPQTAAQSGGRHSRWWLAGSLAAFAAALEGVGSRLLLRTGDSLQNLQQLAAECDAGTVLWNRRYEPTGLEQDRRIKAALKEAGLEARSFNGALLNEPWDLETGSGGPYKVFTPYWKACLTRREVGAPLPAPTHLLAPDEWPTAQPLPAAPAAIGDQVEDCWQPGEAGAGRALEDFCTTALEDYGSGRDLPGTVGTSRLSPHLHFGEISPRTLWQRLDGGHGQGAEYLREIGWREFAYHLLYHFPHTVERPLRPEFERFPWLDDEQGLAQWQAGMTGYPLVDAGMRQLARTGWMHNRVRMVVASFLVKDLLVDWRRGVAVFWDGLVDADLANNTLGWQWTAGCGADAAPFFRIFNPVSQGSRYDPKGTYVRQWVPELKDIPDRWIHRPWEAPVEVLAQAGVRLGEEYPLPIVDHAFARGRALEALKKTKAAKP